MKRAGIILGLACLLLSGCATIFPNTAKTIEPVPLEEAATAVAADVEMWIEKLGWIFGLLFGV